MKKLILILFPLFISLLAAAQFPSNPTSGNINWNTHNLGAFTGDRGICAGTLTDTTTWNLLNYVRTVPGIIVNTTTPDASWRRNLAATRWDKITTGDIPAVTNIYNSDGTLIGNRSVNGGGYNLVFSNTNTIAIEGVNVGVGGSSTDLAVIKSDSVVIDISSKGAGKVLTSDANGGVSWQTASGSSISGLTTNTITKATSSTTIGNSQIFDDGTSVGIGTSSPASKLVIQNSASNLSLSVGTVSFSNKLLVDSSGQLNYYGVNYGTANYERLRIGRVFTTEFEVSTQNGGTGSQRPLNIDASITKFRIAGSTKWTINASGNFVGGSDNLFDIGESVAARPRTGYFGTSVVTNGFSTGYVAKTTTYTATASDYTIDCTSGTFTVTLPTATGITGRIYVVKNSGVGTITVQGTSQNIDGSATQTISVQYASLTLQSTGSGWIIL